MTQKIWFITGISSGLGKALAQSVIENGDFVIGTFRSQTQADAFNSVHNDVAFALKLDITKPSSVSALAETLLSFSPLGGVGKSDQSRKTIPLYSNLSKVIFKQSTITKPRATVANLRGFSF